MKISHFFTLFLLLQLNIAFTQVKFYVKSDASGLEDGTSWQNAFTSFTNALNLVNDNDTIWVARGVYFPTNTSDVSKYFLIDKNISIIGGFTGIENNLNERDYNKNYSILSGNIGDTSQVIDNSNQIAKVIFDQKKILIDGMVFNDANGENTNGSAISVETNSTEAGELIIQNCQFNKNTAFSGGAIFIKKTAGFFQNVHIRNCDFSDNTAFFQGGAISYECITAFDIVKIDNCKFKKNTGKQGSGAIGFEDVYDGIINIIKCSFWENKTAYSGMPGGAIFFTYNDSPFISIDSCLFDSNNAGIGGSLGFYNYFPNLASSTNIRIHNTTFINNRSTDNAGTIILHHSNGALNIDLKNTLFKNNVGVNGAGGIVIDANSGSKVNFYADRLTMIGNYAVSQPAAGGAIYIRTNDDYAPTKLIVRIQNSIFAKNGGVGAFLTAKSTGDIEFANCTFYQNSTYPFLKNWLPSFDYVNFYETMKFYNCLIWENTALKKVFYNNNFTNYSVHDYYVYNSIINTPTCEYNGVSVCQKDVLLQKKPKFRNPELNDFRIAVCSPAIDFGDKMHADSIGLMEDYFGNPRFVNNKIDVGAIESPDTAMFIQSNFTDSIEIMANNGSINIDSVFGGWPPYLINWATGQQTFDLINLIAGQYLAVISDSIGCKNNFIFNIDEYLKSTELQAFVQKTKIWPNPIFEEATIRFENENNDILTLKLMDSHGKLIWQKENIHFPFHFQKENLSTGVYFLVYQNARNIGASKIIFR